MRSDQLLALPVRLHGISVGRPVDLLVDLEDAKAIGLDVICGDDVHRFLPFPTALVSADEIAIRSPFLLLEEDQLAFYRPRTVALSALRGKRVLRERRDVGKLDEIVVRSDGSVAAVVADGQDVPYDDTIRIQSEKRAAAVS